jgi:hypothetical protein
VGSNPSDGTGENMKFEEISDWFWDLKPMRWAWNKWLDFRGLYIAKYHLIDCRDPHNGYNGGWFDRSDIILYANFRILVEFMEKEAFDCYVNWEHEDMIDRWKELNELYNWWKKGRMEEQNACSTLFDEAGCSFDFKPIPNSEYFELNSITKDQSKYDEWKKEHERLANKEDEMLLRLIKVRHYMWT